MRFPEFDGEWEMKELEEICIAIGDGLHGTPKYTESTGYYFINGNNLINGKIFISKNTKEVSYDEWLKNKKEFTNNTLLLSINGTIGNVAKYMAENVILGKSVAYLNFKEDYHFFYHLLMCDKIQNNFYSELTGTTIKNLSLKTIRETKIVFPCGSEQIRIANFLTCIDERIQTQSKIIEELQVLKSSLSKMIFAQRLHFSEFNSKWKSLSLREICEIIGGGTPETNKNEYWNGNIQWFTPTEIKTNFVSKSERTITELGFKNSSAKILPKGAILLTTRATIGEVAIALEECTTNQGFQSLVTKNNYNNIFVFNWLKEHKYKLIKKASGSTFPEISKSEIEKIEILIPSLLEQIKIAAFLSSIDQKVDVEISILKLLNKQKQYLLQQMFI